MELLPHQDEAVDKFSNIKACLIGDSMGVGKTVTGIGRDLRLRRDHGKPGSHIRTLIICQKSGLSVWYRHLRAFGIPDNRILVIDPGDRKPFERELARGATKYDYYIVHWNVLTKLEDLTAPPKITWHHVIADEAHLAKNRNSARTRELKKLSAATKTALSGTPADNKPQDLWSILNWLYPQKFRSFWKFYDQYIEYETGYTGYRIQTGVKNLDKLHEEISPIYIRRTLHDVREDMPPKNYSTITVELGAKQRREYERMREFAMMSLPDGEELAAPIAVSVIMRLQQMTAGTCHVDWTPDDWIEYQKALIEWEDAVNEWEFSDKKSPKPKRPAGPPITIREPSPKLDALMELIEDNEDESFVVFTNFASVAEMVKDKCDHKGISCVTYTGAVTSKELRDASVADFQSKKARVFVGTIGAAGTTITLNAAHTVVFLDRHWNPSFNEQAEDRVYRIDNDDLPVQIIDIVAKNTADEEKIQKLGTKTQWLKDFLTPRG